MVELEDVQPVELDVLNTHCGRPQVNDPLHYNEVSKGEGHVIIYNFDLEVRFFKFQIYLADPFHIQQDC